MLQELLLSSWYFRRKVVLRERTSSGVLCIPLLLSSIHFLHERSDSAVPQESSELLLALKGAFLLPLTLNAQQQHGFNNCGRRSTSLAGRRSPLVLFSVYRTSDIRTKSVFKKQMVVSSSCAQNRSISCTHSRVVRIVLLPPI